MHEWLDKNMDGWMDDGQDDGWIIYTTLKLGFLRLGF